MEARLWRPPPSPKFRGHAQKFDPNTKSSICYRLSIRGNRSIQLCSTIYLSRTIFALMLNMMILNDYTIVTVMEEVGSYLEQERQVHGLVYAKPLEIQAVICPSYDADQTEYPQTCLLHSCFVSGRQVRTGLTPLLLRSTCLIDHSDTFYFARHLGIVRNSFSAVSC